MSQFMTNALIALAVLVFLAIFGIITYKYIIPLLIPPQPQPQPNPNPNPNPTPEPEPTPPTPTPTPSPTPTPIPPAPTPKQQPCIIKGIRVPSPWITIRIHGCCF